MQVFKPTEDDTTDVTSDYDGEASEHETALASLRLDKLIQSHTNRLTAFKILRSSVSVPIFPL